MAKKSEIQRFMERVDTLTANLTILWPVVIVTFATAFFAAQRTSGAEANSNIISIALTFFEIFLVVALAAGFWTVRGAAIERAEDVARSLARECAENEVREYVRSFVTPKLIREIIEKSEDLGGGERLTQQSVDDMMSKLD